MAYLHGLRRVVLSLVGALVLLGGCSPAQTEAVRKDSANTASAPSPPDLSAGNGGTAVAADVSAEGVEETDAATLALFRRLHQGDPISDAEAKHFGEQIEANVASGDLRATEALFSTSVYHEAIVDTLPNKTAAGRKQRKEVEQGSAKAVEQIVQDLITQGAQGGSYTFLSVRDRPEGKCVLMRLLPPTGGLNYQDLILVRRRGKLQVADIYVLVAGERLSQTIGRMTTIVMQQDDVGWLERLSGKERRWHENGEKVSEMTAAMRAQDYARVLGVYQSLPKELQEEKSALLIRVMAAQHLGDAEYLAASEEFRRLFPKDASLDLLLVDGHLLRQDFAAAHAAIDRIDQFVGGDDPHLDILRGNVHLLAGDVDAARRIADAQLKQYPNQIDLYWLLVSISLKTEDYRATSRFLTEIRDKFQFEIGDLTSVPDYAGYVKSPEYAKWKAQIAAPPTADLDGC